MQSQSMENLVDRINKHCERHGITWTAFGIQATKDPRLVFDIAHRGREPRQATIEKIEAVLQEDQTLP